MKINYDKNKKLELLDKVGFKKYFNANSWEEYNKKFFDGLAEKYDAANVMHSFGTKNMYDRKAISNIDIPLGGKVLDICTGSGDISVHIAKTRPDVEIVGIDASLKMMEYAKVKARGLKNISFIQGDALNLPFEDNKFDVAIISFGLRNLTDLVLGLKEMRRVVKNGGYISNIDQGKPVNSLFNMIYKVYFFNIAPYLGKLVFHRGEFNSFRYLPESNKFFPHQDELMRLFQEIGTKEVKNYNFLCGAIAQQIGKVVKDY